VVDRFESGNKPSVIIKGMCFLEQLSDHQLFKKSSVECSGSIPSLLFPSQFFWGDGFHE
jgi:hypothetical protein